MVMTEKQKYVKSSFNINFNSNVYACCHKCDRLFKFPESVLQTCSIASLTFVDDSEGDLSITAVHIWTVAHLADVGAIKGRRHLIQGDGGIPSQNISRPHRMTFKTPLLGRVWYLLVVKHLIHTHAHRHNPVKLSLQFQASMRKFSPYNTQRHSC